ncbi:MAG: ABC transporter permease [Rhodanobacteraceae bacterium]
MRDLLYALWRYRHFILSAIWNDLRTRFARSRLGAIWLILQPLAQSAIYALILSRVLATRLPGVTNRYAYVIYLLAGMLSWSLFAEVVMRCLTVFVDNANLMKKIVFPRMCLPLVVSGSALVNNLFLLAATLVIYVSIGHEPTFAWLWLPVLIAITLAFALGLGLVLGVLNVFVRDVAQVMVVVLQLWFWLTPVVYMTSVLPGRASALMHLNPMFQMVTAFQRTLLWGQAPSIKGLIGVAVVAMVLLGMALVLFRRSSPDMVDVL